MWAGRAKLWVNGDLTINNWDSQTPGDFFYGQGTIEEKATVDLVAGQAVELLVEYTNTPPTKDEGDDISSQPALMLGVVSKPVFIYSTLLTFISVWEAVKKSTRMQRSNLRLLSLRKATQFCS